MIHKKNNHTSNDPHKTNNSPNDQHKTNHTSNDPHKAIILQMIHINQGYPK